MPLWLACIVLNQLLTMRLLILKVNLAKCMILNLTLIQQKQVAKVLTPPVKLLNLVLIILIHFSDTLLVKMDILMLLWLILILSPFLVVLVLQPSAIFLEPKVANLIKSKVSNDIISVKIFDLL